MPLLKATPATVPAVGSPAITLDPDPASWPALLRAHPRPTDDHRHFREQLGLPTDRPIVMAGHQPAFWHAGILAKLLAANALAARTGAAVAWLVVDFDDHPPLHTRLPATDPQGRLRQRPWSIDASDAPGATLALARPAATPMPPRLPPGWTLPEPVRRRAEHAREALAARAGAPNAAVQVTEALLDLLEPITPRPTVVYASRLARTDVFARAIDLARTRPETPHALFNDAAAQSPDADVRALTTRYDNAPELPFWRIDECARRPAYGPDLISTPIDRLLPRGLLMTGLARLGACDLFIHGTGGAAYEPINDRWLTRWLSASPLAPFATATADLTLSLDAPGVTPADAADARWRARHARHHPAALGDTAGQQRRNALLEAIHDAPRRSRDRARLFAELHALTDAAARTHGQELDALDAEADDLARAAAAPLHADRTWPVFLHDPERLAALRDAIEARFS